MWDFPRDKTEFAVEANVSLAEADTTEALKIARPTLLRPTPASCGFRNDAGVLTITGWMSDNLWRHAFDCSDTTGLHVDLEGVDTLVCVLCAGCGDCGFRGARRSGASPGP